MWHDFGLRQLMCITRRPIHFASIITISIPIPVGNLNPPNWILRLYGVRSIWRPPPPFGTVFPGCIVPNISYIRTQYSVHKIIFAVLILYVGVLQGDLQKGDVHGSVSGPDLPLHHPSATAVGSMIIIPGPFHAVSSPSTTYNVNNNVRTRYAAYIIYNILYPKPTRSLVYIKPSLKKAFVI